MIVPSNDVRVLDHRPAMMVSYWKRIAVLVALPLLLLCAWIGRERRRRMISELVAQVKVCVNRGELEALVGRPLYAMDGRALQLDGGTLGIQQPDRVEVYEVNGCTIEVVFFSSDGRCEIYGYETPMVVDIVARVGSKGRANAS